ncbi:MAG: response regulator transcription factor [Ignavibacteria bacterium]|nr:response regulator transcription factor [Ignavibacteria bacterium]
MKKIKVLLVDDHQIIRDGVRTMLVTEKEVDIVGCASGSEEALKLIQSHKPDIVITDISMPDHTGIELTQSITEKFPSVRVLILSMYTSEDYICQAIQSGAKGFLPKQDTTKQILLEAIQTLHRNEEYFSPSVSKILASRYVQQVKNVSKVPATRKFSLTDREKEILKLYAEGFSNQEIADKLHISIRTVETHKNNIMQKFDFKSTVEMVKYALKNNLITIK